MITWVTVWVLTVYDVTYQKSVNYQLSYSTREVCEKQIKRHVDKSYNRVAFCDFQQVPVYTGGKK